MSLIYWYAGTLFKIVTFVFFWCFHSSKWSESGAFWDARSGSELNYYGSTELASQLGSYRYKLPVIEISNCTLLLKMEANQNKCLFSSPTWGERRVGWTWGLACWAAAPPTCPPATPTCLSLLTSSIRKKIFWQCFKSEFFKSTVVNPDPVGSRILFFARSDPNLDLTYLTRKFI